MRRGLHGGPGAEEELHGGLGTEVGGELHGGPEVEGAIWRTMGRGGYMADQEGGGATWQTRGDGGVGYIADRGRRGGATWRTRGEGGVT